MPASGDCELIRDGFWGQPVNALSSLAFVLVGLWLLRSRPVLGWLSCGVGVGSFLFHGPMPVWAEWAHDVALAALLAGLVLERRGVLLTAAAVTIGITFAVAPDIAEPATAVLALVVAVVLLGSGQLRLPRTRVAVAILALAGIIDGLSRTAGPLCRPGSWLQGHAVWHVGASVALLIWASQEHPESLRRDWPRRRTNRRSSGSIP
jgi:hypothetical protein